MCTRPDDKHKLCSCLRGTSYLSYEKYLSIFGGLGVCRVEIKAFNAQHVKDAYINKNKNPSKSLWPIRCKYNKCKFGHYPLEGPCAPVASPQAPEEHNLGFGVNHSGHKKWSLIEGGPVTHRGLCLVPVHSETANGQNQQNWVSLQHIRRYHEGHSFLLFNGGITKPFYCT